MIPSLIGFMATSIQITRHTKVPNAGGFSWVETILDPIDVRIYDWAQTNREYNTPEGEAKTLTHGILAERDADIIVGHDSYDTFEIADNSSPPIIRTLRIYSKREYDDVNVDANIQCGCGGM